MNATLHFLTNNISKITLVSYYVILVTSECIMHATKYKDQVLTREKAESSGKKYKFNFQTPLPQTEKLKRILIISLSAKYCNNKPKYPLQRTSNKSIAWQNKACKSQATPAHPHIKMRRRPNTNNPIRILNICAFIYVFDWKTVREVRESPVCVCADVKVNTGRKQKSITRPFLHR